ncbi:MAG TPA: ArsA-related P-loop ATPase, partial [Solirubrobacteraceae bacterium]|nr:ArsA-related P-loop ATPase [Solirubrobacteraceae bacterium]
MGTTKSAPAQRDLWARLSDKRVVVCVGAGGVGKTTTSAALALGLAARGRKVAVVTIDPAKRLASALGLRELAGEPVRIDATTFARAGLRVEGELWAMMLDAKRTFDDIIARLAPDERAREEILANPVYRELSTAVAGSHELSAIAKLYELYEEHDFDTIVLDTPPSRNALDFLSAPTRLLGFLEGRALQVFLAPGGLTARLFGRGTALV